MTQPDRHRNGEAANIETIEGVIAATPAWRGRTCRFEPVGGGISNANWRVFVDGIPGSFFVKIPGRGTEMFIDRKTALEASRLAESIGIGPKVHPFPSTSGVEIAEFVEGRRTASNRDFLRAAPRRSVIEAYRTLHAAPQLGLTKTVFDMIEEHRAQIQELGAMVPKEGLPLLAEYERARAAIEASGLDLVPCFNDPMPGNFLFDEDDQLVLIDYEYASNNDRIYDLAAWSVEMFFDDATDHEIVESYFGQALPEHLARLVIYKALADIKWSLWAVVQSRISTLDFDFVKYGIWKCMRARSIIETPDWGKALTKV
ncbi:phosphotransferase [Jiella marina]